MILLIIRGAWTWWNTDRRWTVRWTGTMGFLMLRISHYNRLNFGWLTCRQRHYTSFVYKYMWCGIREYIKDTIQWKSYKTQNKRSKFQQIWYLPFMCFKMFDDVSGRHDFRWAIAKQNRGRLVPPIRESQCWHPQFAIYSACCQSRMECDQCYHLQ